MTWVSDCCSAPIEVSTADEGTSCWMCRDCGKPCDREPEDECDGGDRE